MRASQSEMVVRESAVGAPRPWGRWVVLAVYVTVLLGLAVAWREPALRHWVDPRALSEVGRVLLASPLGPVAVIGGYVLAVAVGMPVLLLVTVGTLLFQPWPGMAYALLGMVSGALVTYGVGRFTGAQTMDALIEGRLRPVARQLQQRGLLTVIAVRVLPVAPFVMINMLAGALRVRLRDYVLGTFLGLLPGTVLISLFLDQLRAAWQQPGLASYLGVAACVAAMLALTVWMRRRQTKSPQT